MALAAAVIVIVIVFVIDLVNIDQYRHCRCHRLTNKEEGCFIIVVVIFVIVVVVVIFGFEGNKLKTGSRS